jgi:hypothetical protein
VRYLVPTSGAVDGTWKARTFNDSSWQGGVGATGVGFERQSGYGPYIAWDVDAAMSGENNTVYVRLQFDVDDPAAFTSLTLRVMYDDGFAAYLNGEPVAAANAPATPAWNSTATQTHDDGQAVVFQPFDLTGYRNLLVAGTNVLAIHGMDAGSNSSDFLIRAELVGAGSFTGDPISISGPTWLRARTALAGSWSGLTEATFVTDVEVPLRVSEVHYHPEPPAAGSPYSADDFEFIELINVGSGPVDLLGVTFAAGVEFDFNSGAVVNLGRGERVLVVGNLAAFASRYDTTGMLIAGQYSGNLENAGEVIALRDGRGVTIQQFAYDDLWYPETDGGGRSLHIVDATRPPEFWGDRAGWLPSRDLGGSPGAAEPPPAGGRQLPGDANQDSALDISDAVSLLGQLFLGASRPPPCSGEISGPGPNRTLLDINGDSSVDLSDAVYLLDYLFLAGPGPSGGTGCIEIEGCPDVCVR